MNDRVLRPRSGTSAKALLLSILGEFALPHGAALWTSTIVRSLGTLGVDERNARQAVGRLAEQGFVRSEKHGRRARWSLTDTGRLLLVDGSKRIYEFGSGRDHWDGRWLIVLCSVPEDQRAKRHQLRSQLEFVGFGFVANAVAITPHLDREGAANSVLERLGLLAQATVFRAEAGGRVEPDELLAKAWDLDDLAAAYDEFLGEFQSRSPATDEERFVGVIELVHSWRRFPFVDPEFPTGLLPDDWSGHVAKRCFDTKHGSWSPGANRWYEAIEADG